MQSVVAITSGGIDSTTLLWYLHEREYDIKEALSFNYGQRHSVELQSAKEVVSTFNQRFEVNVVHRIVDIRSISELIAKGALTGNAAVPHEMYDSESQRITIVPNRNMILLSIAGGRAVTLNADYIAYAAHSSDRSVYPDCRPEFIEQLDKALYLGNLWTPIHILAPFQDLTKIQIVELGLRLRVPFELTWSCYTGGERPCLECGTCLERTEAFLANKTRDPALTQAEWDAAKHFLESTRSKH